MRFIRTDFELLHALRVDFRNLAWVTIVRDFSGKCYSLNKIYFKEPIVLMALENSLKLHKNSISYASFIM